MNSKNKGIFSGVAIIICIFIFCLINSISILSAQKAPKSLDLSSNISVAKKDYVKGTVKFSTPEYCTYVRTLARRIPIPIGTEHYFLIMSEDFSQCISIKADKEWADKFNSGVSLDKNGVPIEGYVNKLDDKVKTSLFKVESNYESKGLKTNVNTDLCIDLFAVKHAKRLLISTIICLITIIWFIVDFSKYGLTYVEKDSAGKRINSIIGIIMFISIIFMLISWQLI